MTVFTEGNLQLTVHNAVNARKFDGPDHGLSHCMKAVDFVVELPDRYLFIEFKDPDHPQSSEQNRKEFEESFRTGQVDEDLKYKYRDSFLYEWASGRADKPIYYYVLVASDTLDRTQLTERTDDLRRKLPIAGPVEWASNIVEDCAVFNIQSWNETFPDYPIVRLATLT